MIEVSNLRKESADGWTKLIANITYGGHVSELEPVMWLAVKDEIADMLADDVYDAFVLLPLFMGMYYKQDVHIHGKISKRLHHNIMHYVQSILCDFSNDLSRIDIQADGFGVSKGEYDIIGAGLSCGVDSLSTVYDNYVNEADPEYKINGLFFFNCGWHGEFGNEDTKKLFFNRYELNKHAADELGLPFYMVDTNFHAFIYGVLDREQDRMSYLANFSCVLGLQRGVKRYYISNGRSYEAIKKYTPEARNHDLSGFADSYLVPLIQTERLELVIDGCQYERTQKIERISGWHIAQKYLNPCSLHSFDFTTDAHNCSKCEKCLRTLLTIESLGRLQDFSGTFDIDTYKRHSFKYKCEVVMKRNTGAHAHDNYLFAKQHGLKLPPYFIACLRIIPVSICSKILRKTLSEKSFQALRKFWRSKF